MCWLIVRGIEVEIMSDGAGFGSFIHEINDPLNNLHKQMSISSGLDNPGKAADINQVAGAKLCRDLRKKVLSIMPKKVVNQKGGRMLKVLTVDGEKFRCEATRVGKSCRYEIRLL